MNLDWLAGFFDGEGGISVHPRTWTVCISLTNRDKLAIMSVLQEFPDGTVSTRQRKVSWAPVSEARWSGKRAIPFLEAMKSRVVIKKTQVELTLRLISLIGNTGDNKASNLPERFRLAEEICSLNTRRGDGKDFATRRGDYRKQAALSKFSSKLEAELDGIEQFDKTLGEVPNNAKSSL